MHAKALGLIHPSTKKSLKWEVDLPDDIKNLLELIRKESKHDLSENTFKINKNHYITDNPISYDDDLEFEDE